MLRKLFSWSTLMFNLDGKNVREQSERMKKDKGRRLWSQGGCWNLRNLFTGGAIVNDD